MSKPISQREACRFRSRVKQLEQQQAEQRRSYGQEWPDGECLLTLQKDEVIDDAELAIVKTAQRLGHPVLVRISTTGSSLHFYGWR